MKTMRMVTASLFLSFAIVAWAQDAGKGALILITKEGQVRFINQDGTPGQAIEVGGLIPRSSTITTGAGSKMTALLSNGTLITMVEKTRMELKVFKQEPFDPQGRKLKDLQKEPSISSVEVELDTGSLIVKTKKLDKSSSFDITSSLGTAGIRGTEFQMALDPGQGIQLDVTESMVAFTPPGGGQPLAVSQGSGLSVTPSGAVTPRAVSPTAARQISVTNETATVKAENISLSDVTMAMEKATSVTEASSNQSFESMHDSGQEDQDDTPESQSEEETPFEEKDGSSAGGESEEPVPADSDKIKNQPNEEGGDTSTGSIEAGTDESSSNPSDSSSPSEPATVSTSAEPAINQNTAQGAVLENNAEIAVVRKTGKVDEYTQSLSRLGLTDEQTLRFYDLSEVARQNIIAGDRSVARRLLNADGFGRETADLYFVYSPATREKLLGLEDDVMVGLINQGIEEDVLAESLTKLNLEFSHPANLPLSRLDPDPLEYRRLALGEELIKHGNEALMEELIELAGGTLTDEWLQVGEMAAKILQDKTLGGELIIESMSSSQVFGNSFYAEVADLYSQLELDTLVAGESHVIAAKNLLVIDNVQALTPYFGEGAKSMILAASENLELAGNLEWSPSSSTGTRLVLMSAGNLKAKPGANLSSVTSDLVISSREHLTIEQVKMEVAQELAIRSLRDLELKNVTIGANALATLKARRDLNVDGLTFNRDVSRIVMEATTMRLRNVDFPAFSTVQLNSLKGGIDGRYPNFGTAIPAASQIGRVNFIENVKSGGNLIMNRASFDQFGQNINIGKINRP